MKKQENFSMLNDTEHVLAKIPMYAGSDKISLISSYILEDNIMVGKDIEAVPAINKLISELIDNSVDEFIRTNGKYANKIEVTIKGNKVNVKDNGRGIPVKKVQTYKGEDWQPKLSWTELKAGTNFSSDNETTIGTFGVGSSLCSILSTEFIGISNDGENSCKVHCKNNNENISVKVTKTTKHGCDVTMFIDMKRFASGDLEYIDENHLKLVEQRLLNLSVTYPDITFTLNSKKIKSTDKSFLSMFGNGIIETTSNYSFGIYNSESDEFQQFTLLNGLTISDGGNHIDYLIGNITNLLRDKLVKKFKNIKPGDIKSKLKFAVIMKNFKRPIYNSQTKEKLTNDRKEITEYFKDIDFDKLVNKILKTPEIIDPITEVYKIKEELKKRQDLKNADKQVKKPKSEKFMPPIGEWTNIFLAEGDSASNSISKILGRQGNGFYAMFGVPPNAYSMDLKDIIGSKKMLDLQQILGLQFSKTTQENINFKNIIITTDFDLPGHFIAGQLFGLFYRFGKNLFEENRIKRLITPLIIVKDKDKIVKWFYTFDDYRDFETKNPDKKFSYEYKKGLGSWDQEELEFIIEKDGLDRMLEIMTTEGASELIDNWLNDSKADARKEMLEGYEFNVMNL